MNVPLRCQSASQRFRVAQLQDVRVEPPHSWSKKRDAKKRASLSISQGLMMHVGEKGGIGVYR